MAWNDGDSLTPHRGSGWLIALGALLAVALVSALVVGIVGAPATSEREGALPAAVSRAAKQLGSDVATSARAMLPLGGRIADVVKTRRIHPYITPIQGKPIMAKALRFTFDGVTYTIAPQVASSVYWGARGSTRLLTQYPGEADEVWASAYYHAFADDPAQKPAIDSVCAQFRAIKAGAHMSQDQYLELITKYVQSIPYDWAAFESDAGTQRFPVETLVECKGLCGDKSVLLADLLAHEGFATALLDFGPEKHMAVGVLGPGRAYPGSGYLFVETTSPCYVTDAPVEYAGGMRLKSAPHVIQIGSGTLQYSAASQIERIVTARETAQTAADRLYREAKSRSLSDSEVTAINKKLSLAFAAQTSLRSNVIDRNGDSVGTFMDRTTALSWITRNGWWM
jgi:hypothetical protein